MSQSCASSILCCVQLFSPCACRHVGDDKGRTHELEQSAVKCMRGILFCYMRQSEKVTAYNRFIIQLSSTQPLDFAKLHFRWSVSSCVSHGRMLFTLALTASLEIPSQLMMSGGTCRLSVLYHKYTVHVCD